MLLVDIGSRDLSASALGVETSSVIWEPKTAPGTVKVLLSLLEVARCTKYVPPPPIINPDVTRSNKMPKDFFMGV